MSFKTKTSVAKRFRITSTGKILRRSCGQDHFNARERGKTRRNKRRGAVLFKGFARTIRQACS
ncbi:MAG: 50S ribosomal protein L35 [Parcubacteria group bacterium]|nr:50S ribosomal protein L35 [Parcubacteria group bacterium]